MTVEGPGSGPTPSGLPPSPTPQPVPAALEVPEQPESLDDEEEEA